MAVCRLMCFALVFLGGVEMSFIPSHPVLCDLDLPADDCTCIAEPDLVVTCKDIGLKSWPDFAGLRGHVISTLDLSGNAFHEIPRDAFEHLAIHHLILSRNVRPLNMIHRDMFNEYQANSVRSLDISDNYLPVVPAAIRNLTSLHKLVLGGNDFNGISNSDFEGLRHLTDLHLGVTYQVAPDIFSDVENLKALSISPKAIYVFPPTLSHFFSSKNLQKMRNLQTLTITAGVISFHHGFFNCMPNLEHLEVSYSAVDDAQVSATMMRVENNKVKYLNLARNLMKKVPTVFIFTLRALEDLNLSHNRIRKVYSRTFKNNRRLKRIDLSHNKIRSVSSTVFSRLNHLRELDLRHNRLRHVAETAFPGHFMNDMVIYLSGNRWQCDCELWWLLRVARRQHQGDPGPLDLFEVENTLTCDNYDHVDDNRFCRIYRYVKCRFYFKN